ncbi:MAG: hypothetical protein ACOC1S_00325 [bacterium]
MISGLPAKYEENGYVQSVAKIKEVSGRGLGLILKILLRRLYWGRKIKNEDYCSLDRRWDCGFLSEN